jgi:nicotinamide riboside transporter PnuC
MHPFHVILYILGIAGVLLNNHRRRECFYVWLVSNTGWMMVDYNAGLYVQAGLFGTYLILAAHGLWKWRDTNGN